MANRPARSSKSAAKRPKKSQVEINRIKPVGVLSLDVLEAKSSNVETINVKLPDGEVYEFYHKSMTVGASEDFISEASTANRVSAVRRMLAGLLVNKDGSPFIKDEADLRAVSWKVLNAIFEAINASDREEPGED